MQMVSELQIIVGTMELGDYEASLRAVDRTKAISEQLRVELVLIIEGRHRDELAVIKAEKAEELADKKKRGPHRL